MSLLADVSRSRKLPNLQLVALSSIAALGTLSIVPALAQDDLLHWKPYRSQETSAVLGARTAASQPYSQETPVVPPPPAKGETAISPASANASPDSGDHKGEPSLMQDPGAASSQKVQAPSASTTGEETTKIHFITGIGDVSSDGYKPLSGKQRWQYYLNQNYFSIGAYFGPVFSSLMDQARDEPPEWGGGMEGYGKRLASRLGAGIVQGSAESAGCALLGLEPRYIRSSSPRVLSRIGHAFLFSVITYNNEGKRRLALPKLASYYAASMTMDLWMPDRHTVLGDSLREGSQQIIVSSLVNQFQEFWPDIKRIFLRRP